MKIEVTLDDKALEKMSTDEVEVHEVPIECDAYLILAFKGKEIMTRACGPVSVTGIATALTDNESRDLDAAVCLAAAKILLDRVCPQ